MLEIVFMSLSPLNQQRIQRFKANRRGVISLVVFVLLLLLTLAAELVANDRPIVLSYQDQLYYPVFNTYSETTFGGDFETEAYYKDSELIARIEQHGWMIWPIIPYSYSTVDYDLGQPAPSAPDHQHWLGTDDQGRDVLARSIYGYRISVLFALVLTGLSAVIGIFLGAVQGYFGGWVDLILQRVIEIWSGLPVLFLLIILASMVVPNVVWLLLILLLFSWMSLAQMVRAEFLRARNFEYVKAARVLGVGEWTIMLRHVLPNALVAAFTLLPFMLSSAVTALTTLDFLGFGLPPGSASLGELLLQGKNNPSAPWLGFTGFFVLAGLLTVIIFVSEAVRDAFDPRKVVL